jgi:catechol 2,3-dioxygenase-like lactoylglutathione lyase family enzyme
VIGKLQCVVLDCPDVLELARFYRSVLGGEVNRPDPRWSLDDDFATLHMGTGMVLAFQRALDHRPPQWPNPEFPQQFHLDVEVPDLDEAQEHVLAQGAKLLHVDAGGWRIFADPAGHPFCLLKG